MRLTRLLKLVLAVGIGAIAPSWSPAFSQAATPGECVVHSAPSFVAQGIKSYAASVGDVVEVACSQSAGQPVTLEDPELYGRSPPRTARSRGRA